MIEIWKDIKGYESDYQASNLGNIRSLKNGKELLLKPSVKDNLYRAVSLWKNNKATNKYVHKLVWEAFNGETDLKVDHIIEGNKSNNRLDNLQVLNHRDNINKYYINKNKSSKYIGVSFNSNKRKWKASIRIGSIRKHLGYFYEEYNAAEAYYKAVNSLS